MSALSSPETERRYRQVTISRHSKATPLEQEILIINLKNQINNLQTKFKYTEKLLQSEKEKSQLLYEVKDFRARLETPESLLEFQAPKKTERKETLCVLKADLKGFSDFMAMGRDIELSHKVEMTVKHEATHCRFFKAGEGDAVQIVHYNPQHLAKVADMIMKDFLHEHPDKPKFRMAIDCGEVTYEEQDGKITKLLSGSPLLTAARIEPCVTPGEIWVTEPVKALLDHKGGRYKAVEIKPAEIGHLESKDGKFNVKKEGSKKNDFFLKLFRLTDNA